MRDRVQIYFIVCGCDRAYIHTQPAGQHQDFAAPCVTLALFPLLYMHPGVAAGSAPASPWPLAWWH